LLFNSKINKTQRRKQLEEEEEETLFETRMIDERKHVWAGFL
jgi:hypothetical protein